MMIAQAAIEEQGPMDSVSHVANAGTSLRAAALRD